MPVIRLTKCNQFSVGGDGIPKLERVLLRRHDRVDITTDEARIWSAYTNDNDLVKKGSHNSDDGGGGEL